MEGSLNELVNKEGDELLEKDRSTFLEKCIPIYQVPHHVQKLKKNNCKEKYDHRGS